jgi:hypothetical protein
MQAPIKEVLIRLEELAGNDPSRPSRFFTAILTAPNRPALVKSIHLNPSLDPALPTSQSVQFTESLIMYLWDTICAAPLRFCATDARPGHTYFGVAVEDWSRAYSLLNFIQNRGARFMKPPGSSLSEGLFWGDVSSGTAATIPDAEGNPEADLPEADDENIAGSTLAQQAVFLLTTQAKMKLLREEFGFADPRKVELQLLATIDESTLETGKELTKYDAKDPDRIMKYVAGESISTAVFTATRFVHGKDVRVRSAAPVLDLRSQDKFIQSLWEHHLANEVITNQKNVPDLSQIFERIRTVNEGADTAAAVDHLASENAAAIALNNSADQSTAGITSELLTDEINIRKETIEKLPSLRMFITSDEVFTAENLPTEFTFESAMQFLGLSLTNYYATKQDPDPTKRNIVRLRESYEKDKQQYIFLKDLGLNPGQIIG